MDKSLSEQQELLLYKACKEKGGTLTMEMARRVYSSKNSAKSAIQKLATFDYIERQAPGAFKVVNLPTDVKEELEQEFDE